MRLSAALAPERILDLQSTEKIPAIQEMIDFLSSSVDLGDPEALLQHVMERESIGSTGINEGVAITHAHCDQVNGVTTALGIKPQRARLRQPRRPGRYPLSRSLRRSDRYA